MPDLFADIPPAQPAKATVALTVELLRSEATLFSEMESSHAEVSLYGVSDGKAIGTYLEHKFRTYLTNKGYSYQMGNAANGLDFPGLAWTSTSRSQASNSPSRPALSALSARRFTASGIRSSCSFTTRPTCWPPSEGKGFDL